MSSLILVALIIARTIYSLITGYILPDESFYYSLFVVQGLGFSVYRPILHLGYVLFFTGTHSLPELLIRGAIFCGVWALGSIILLSKILQALEIQEKPRAFVILSFVLMPVFPLMAVFFVTETMALFLALSGIYFSIQYLKQGGNKNGAIAAAMFLFASQVREPYMLFIFGVPAVLLALRRSIKSLLGYAAVAFIALPFPTSIHPLSINQPIADIIFEFLPNLIISVANRFMAVNNAILNWAWTVPGQLWAIITYVPHSAPVGSVAPSLEGISNSLIAAIAANNPVGASGGSQPIIPAYVFSAANTVHLTFGPSEYYAFFLGLAYGLGPILMILTFTAFYFSFKEKSKLGFLILTVSGLGMASFFVTANFAVEYLPDALSLWLSNIIRLSSAALPAAIGLGYLYSRLEDRTILTAIGITLLLGLILLPNFANAIQSSQNIQGGNIDRLNLNYRAPYLKMAEIAVPNSLIITGSSGYGQMTTFASMLSNVTVLGFPANQSGFDSLISRNYSTIYLYDSWVSLQNPDFFKQCECYPQWYVNIVLSHSYRNNSIVILWSNGESYGEELLR